MTKRQCLEVMAYLAAAINKEPLSDMAGDVYFDLLGDLPVETLRLAAKKVVLAHKWATFPSVAELREAASEVINWELADLHPGKCWALAKEAVARIDPELQGPYMAQDKSGKMVQYPSQTAAVMAGLPSLVANMIRGMGGPRAMIASKDPMSVLRGQFMKIAEAEIKKRRELALMPPGLQKQIAEVQRSNPAITAAVKQIGVDDPTRR